MAQKENTRKVHIFKHRKQGYYYSLNAKRISDRDRFVTTVEDADDAFSYVQQQNKVIKRKAAH